VAKNPEKMFSQNRHYIR